MDHSRITEFALHLISNADQRRHPHNVISAFSTTVNSPLQLQYGTWTCGLRNISYPSRLVNIDNREQTGIEFPGTNGPIESEVTITAKTIKPPTEEDGSYRQSGESDHSSPLNLVDLRAETLVTTLNQSFQDIKIHRYLRMREIFSAILKIYIYELRNGQWTTHRKQIHIGYLLSLARNIEDFISLLNSVLASLLSNYNDQPFLVFTMTGNALSLEILNNCMVKLNIDCKNTTAECKRLFWLILGLSMEMKRLKIQLSLRQSIMTNQLQNTVVSTNLPITRTPDKYKVSIFSMNESFFEDYKLNVHSLCFSDVDEHSQITYHTTENDSSVSYDFTLLQISAVSSVEELSNLLFNQIPNEAIELRYDEETSLFSIVNNSQLEVSINIKDFSNVLGNILGLQPNNFSLDSKIVYGNYNIDISAQSSFLCPRLPKLDFFESNKTKLSSLITAESGGTGSSVSCLFNDDFSADVEGFVGIELSLVFNFSMATCNLLCLKSIQDYTDDGRVSFSLNPDVAYSGSENFNEIQYNPTTQLFSTNLELPTIVRINDNQITRLCKYENTAYCTIGSVFPEITIYNIYLNQTLEADIQTPASFSNAQQLQETLLDSFAPFHIRSIDTRLSTIRDILDIKHNAVMNKFFFKLKPISQDNSLPTDIISHLVLYLSPKLSLLFGFGFKITTLNLHRNISNSFPSLSMYLEQCNIFNMRDVFGNFHNTLLGDHNVDLLSGVYNMMIHCDFIRNNFVGNDSLNILDIVPFIFDERDYITFEPKNMLYKTVKQEEMRDIRVEILDTRGNRIPFVSGTSPVHLTLVFKRIK